MVFWIVALAGGIVIARLTLELFRDFSGAALTVYVLLVGAMLGLAACLS